MLPLNTYTNFIVYYIYIYVYIYIHTYLYYSRKQYSPLSPSSAEESDSPLEHINIDLMHELRDVIFPNTPPVDRTVSLSIFIHYYFVICTKIWIILVIKNDEDIFI